MAKPGQFHAKCNYEGNTVVQSLQICLVISINVIAEMDMHKYKALCPHAEQKTLLLLSEHTLGSQKIRSWGRKLTEIPRKMHFHYFFIVLYCIAFYSIVFYCIVFYSIVLYSIVSYRIASHRIALHCIALHCTALHCTALHCTVLYCTVLYWSNATKTLRQISP